MGTLTSWNPPGHSRPVTGLLYLYLFTLILKFCGQVISWINCCKNEDVLRRVKEDRNTLRKIKRINAKSVGCISRRNCLLKHLIEGETVGTIRRGRRRKQLPDGLKETRGYKKLKEKALARSPENSLWKKPWTS